MKTTSPKNTAIPRSDGRPMSSSSMPAPVTARVSGSAVSTAISSTSGS